MIAAVIFAAAFAGLVLVADDASAEEVPYTVTYTLGDSSVVKTADAEGYIVLLTAEDVESVYTPAAGERFVGWITTGNVVYDFGATIKLTENIALTPNLKEFAKEVYFDVAGEDRVTEEISDTRADQSVPADPTPAEGFKFVGWMYSVDGKIYSSDDIKDSSKIETIAKESVFTAQFEEIFDVFFIADGVTVRQIGTESDVTAPANDPSKANYIFGGWFDKKGVEFSENYVFTEDTAFYAYFEPVTYSVHFVVDGEVYAERSSKYGYQIDLPTLPEGYKAWADADGNVVSSPVTILGETTFTAVADVYYDVNFINGELIIASVAVLENTVIPADKIPAIPADCSGWDFDFTQIITEDKDIMSVPIEYVDVTFDYGDKNFDNVTVTIVKGTAVPADQVPAIPESFPKADQTWDIDLSVPVTEDMTVTLRDNIYYTVTFMAGETVIGTATVLEKTKATAPELPEGYKAWDFDFETPITADTTIKAIAKEAVFDVTFVIEGKTPVTQKSDSISVPATAIDGKVFKGWVVQGESSYVDPATYKITQDVTFVAIYDKAPAPAGPGFFQTTTGQCTIVILVVLVLAFIYAVHTNMWGLKDTLASFKLQRVKKE